MKAVDICIFLTAYTLVVAGATLCDWFRHRRVISLATIAVALLAISATTMTGTYLDPSKSYLQTLQFLVEQRDSSMVISAAMGLAVGLVWIHRVASNHIIDQQSEPSVVRQSIRQGILIASIVGVVSCGLAFVWKDIVGFQRDPPARVHAAEFVIEKIADLDFSPLRVTTDEQGTVYVCYDYFETWGTMGGAIVELTDRESPGRFNKRIVADSTLLMRCYGLAARNGSLFVSRTGIFPRAEEGKISYDPAAAITQLQDLDGDGYFEYVHDVATDLPGARGPDTMQQNNGICFGPDGSLFVTTSSAANRVLTDHPWAGCILKYSPDFSSQEVFAAGFRNPFGVAIGPSGELFVTDNDIDENPGDEVNHVVRGGHYGHPFVVPNEAGVEPDGFHDPIHLGELESNYLGLTYGGSTTLPEEYRDSLYVTDFMQHKIWRMQLKKAGDTFQVTGVTPFASLSSPVDIAISPDGQFYIVSRKTRNIYRIRLRDGLARD